MSLNKCLCYKYRQHRNALIYYNCDDDSQKINKEFRGKEENSKTKSVFDNYIKEVSCKYKADNWLG